MARRTRSRSRRSEDFAVRRWLQVGVASAGMGAALWGMSLVGPQVAAAAADEGSAGSTSTSSESVPSNKETAQDDSSTGAGADTTSATDTDTEDDSDTSESDLDDDFAEESDADSAETETETETDDGATETELDDGETGFDETETDLGETETELDDSQPEELGTGGTEAAGSGGTDSGVSEIEDTAAIVDQSTVTPTAYLVPGPATTGTDSAPSVSASDVPESGDPWAIKQEVIPGNPWQENTADIIESTTANIELLLLAIPLLPPEIREAFIGTLWTMRRTFFNLAPRLDETSLVSSGLGEISGRVLATDPEGDEIRYRIVQGPSYGTLELNADGTYTYTPDGDFDGVDTLVIGVYDVGFHLNLIQPFRAPGPAAGLLINQNAVDFLFNYDDPGGYFTDEAKEALYQSAKRLSVYFVVDQKTVLTYSVNSVYTPEGFLASAGSNLVSDEPGFWYTVVQQKLIDGTDANGAADDGHINWNWAYDWGFYPSVGSDEYDFTSTVMHELLHSFGWLSYTEYPGDTEQTAWTVYDQFVTTRRGDSPIDPETYRWDSDYDPYLIGYDGGMFFSGAEAMAAYGNRPVPLYTPQEWSGGSSISHLEDAVFSGPNHAMMDHAAAGMGPDNISLSPVELGVLMDLGYTVVSWPWFNYPQLVPSEDEDDL